MDGLVISLCYEDGYFVFGVIRGDGSIGEDVIVNLCEISDIFKCLYGKDWLDVLEVCGEVYMVCVDFEVYNEWVCLYGGKVLVNLCNVVVGLLC